jgi:hypothetical protein
MYAKARPPRAALWRAHLSLPPAKDAERSGKNPVGRSGGQFKTLEYGGVVACPGRHVETEQAGAKGRVPHGSEPEHHRAAAAGRACVAVSGARAPDRSTVPGRASGHTAGRPTNTNARQSGAAETSLAFVRGPIDGWVLLGGLPARLRSASARSPSTGRRRPATTPPDCGVSGPGRWHRSCSCRGGLGLAGCLGWPLLGGCPSGRLGGWPDDWLGGLARDNTLACVRHPW